MKNILLCIMYVCSLCTPIYGVLTADFGLTALILGIVGAAIAGATAIGTSAASAVKSHQAELKADINKAKNDSWFNKEYYQDSLAKKENQDMLSELSKKFGDNSQTQAATSNVLGISPDISRQMNIQENQAYSNSVGGIKSNEDNFKQSILDNYKQKDAQYTQQKMQAKGAQAQALAQIGTGTAQVAGNVADVIGSPSTSKTTQVDTQVNIDSNN